MEPCQGRPLLVQRADLLQEGRRLAEEDRVAGSAEHEIGPAPMGKHVE
jgi:hypothetical protein